jgi:hypothetical protein
MNYFTQLHHYPHFELFQHSRLFYPPIAEFNGESAALDVCTRAIYELGEKFLIPQDNTDSLEKLEGPGQRLQLSLLKRFFFI